MKVAISEIIKDKIFLFLATIASPEDLANLEGTISHWMDAKVLELQASGHAICRRILSYMPSSGGHFCY